MFLRKNKKTQKTFLRLWLEAQRAGGNLHKKLAIDGTPLQIGFPPYQILLYHRPIRSHNNGLDTQNKLEATSHPKLATDGASPMIAPILAV